MKTYASINRGKKSGSGTRIRITEKKHGLLYKFLQHKFEEADKLNESNPEAVPCFIVDKKDWDKFARILKAGRGVGYTKIYIDSYEFCIICQKSFRAEIMDTELLRHEASKKREADKLKEEE